jgi:hypothetical protein
VKNAISLPDNWTFLFQNPATKEKYATHIDFTQTTKFEKVTFENANSIVTDNYADKDYFLPYLEELNYLYKQIDKYSFIPRKIFWSSDIHINKVKCFNMENGQTVLLDKTEMAYLLPLKMIK